jgi:hypothetical protein
MVGVGQAQVYLLWPVPGDVLVRPGLVVLNGYSSACLASITASSISSMNNRQYLSDAEKPERLPLPLDDRHRVPRLRRREFDARRGKAAPSAR